MTDRQLQAHIQNALDWDPMRPVARRVPLPASRTSRIVSRLFPDPTGGPR